jgi:hypothetical protein
VATQKSTAAAMVRCFDSLALRLPELKEIVSGGEGLEELLDILPAGKIRKHVVMHWVLQITHLRGLRNVRGTPCSERSSIAVIL